MVGRIYLDFDGVAGWTLSTSKVKFQSNEKPLTS